MGFCSLCDLVRLKGRREVLGMKMPTPMTFPTLATRKTTKGVHEVIKSKLLHWVDA